MGLPHQSWGIRVDAGTPALAEGMCTHADSFPVTNRMRIVFLCAPNVGDAPSMTTRSVDIVLGFRGRTAPPSVWLCLTVSSYCCKRWLPWELMCKSRREVQTAVDKKKCTSFRRFENRAVGNAMCVQQLFKEARCSHFIAA